MATKAPTSRKTAAPAKTVAVTAAAEPAAAPKPGQIYFFPKVVWFHPVTDQGRQVELGRKGCDIGPGTAFE
jgi:hypothetical protein